MSATQQTFDRVFDELLKAAPSIFGDSFALSTSPVFSNLRQYEDRVQEVASAIQILSAKCLEGFLLVTKNLIKDGKENPLIAAFSSLRKPITLRKSFLQVLGGASWREALTIPEDFFFLLYAEAKKLFDGGSFEKAIPCFTFLCWFDAKQYDCWMGLGHSQFHSDAYFSAIDAYAAARLCQPEACLPCIYTAACFEAVGDVEQATSFLRAGLQLENEKLHPDHVLLQTVEKKLEELKQNSAVPTT